MDPAAKARDLFLLGYYRRCLQLLQETAAATAASPQALVGSGGSGSVAEVKAELAVLELLCVYGCTGTRSFSAFTSALQKHKPAFRLDDAATEDLVKQALRCWSVDVSDDLQKEALAALKDSARLLRSQAFTWLVFLAASALCGNTSPNATNMIAGFDYLKTEGEQIQSLHFLHHLLIYRYDLMEVLFPAVFEGHEDAAATKVVTAVKSIAEGNYSEAHLTYGDVQVQFCDGDVKDELSSLTILNGRAVALMFQARWAEAAQELSRALVISDSDVDTLVNLVACSRHNRQDEEAEKHFAKLLAVDKSTVADDAQLAEAFKQFAAAHSA